MIPMGQQFKNLPEIVCQSCTQTSTTNSEKTVVGSKVNIDNKPAAGTAYRITLAGTNSGGNAAHTAKLLIGSTAVMTLTADAVTAVDWMATFVVVFKDAKAQRVMGNMQGNALDCENDYAAGSVDCTAGAEMKVQINSGHESDTVTCEVCVVEKWQQELTTE